MGLELSSSGGNGNENNDRSRGGRGIGGGRRDGGGISPLAAAAGENDEMVQANNHDDDNANALPIPAVVQAMDAFYASRFLDEDDNVDGDGRPPNGRGRNLLRGGSRRHPFLSSRNQPMPMTYVEEKSLFWKRKRGIEEEGNTLPSTSYPLRGRVASFPRRFLYVPDPPPFTLCSNIRLPWRLLRLHPMQERGWGDWEAWRHHRRCRVACLICVLYWWRKHPHRNTTIPTLLFMHRL